jgi:hypothetical protein
LLKVIGWEAEKSSPLISAFRLLRFDYFNRSVERITGNFMTVNLPAVVVLNKKLSPVSVVEDCDFVAVDY